jgi:hypothetical protein
VTGTVRIGRDGKALEYLLRKVTPEDEQMVTKSEQALGG